MSYTGWLLPEPQRAKLLAKFPAIYHDTIAHHVTLRMGIAELPTATVGEVVGAVDDGRGCQALVVAIDGVTERWDGATYHITWSLDRDIYQRKPVHAMAVLQELGWQPVAPIAIDLIPMVFPD